jgi:hypothetical protein
MKFNPFERFNPENPDVEFYWSELRRQRNKLLTSCDWTVLSDSPLDVQTWSEYRQALRDLPSNTKDPKLAIFPTKPE